MILEALLCIILALLAIALMCFIKVLDEKIIEIYALIDALNEWVHYHNKLTKRMFKDLEAFRANQNFKPELSD